MPYALRLYLYFFVALSNREAEAGQRDYDDLHSTFLHRKKAHHRACGQIPAPGRLLTRVVLCLMAWTSKNSSASPPTTWIRFLKAHSPAICPCSRQRRLNSPSIFRRQNKLV